MPFLDPARRDGAGRVFDPAAMNPSWDVVSQFLTQPAVVKTLPGFPHRLLPEGVEAQWVSDGGDLVEACLWGPGLATAPRSATALPSGAELIGFGDHGDVGEVGTWLHEPDDAVIRAGLVGELAARMGGRLVDAHLAYVTTDDASPDPLTRSFRIVEELPHREKPMRAALSRPRRRDADGQEARRRRRAGAAGEAAQAEGLPAGDGDPRSDRRRGPLFPG